MSYIVFARKYRPQAFDEVVGQAHITTTLENAISQGRVAHAYLFSGPRGIGKTTTARILAKAMNCEKGPTVSPCNKCASCGEITQGINLDILEIDGASNRGIEEIRNLRENIKFSPSKGKFKIYIIDEVHMLTQEAFNALLKILEEPPPHVKFIFATTQAHKVPATILSRCQRFDFKRISINDILANLKKIAKVEKLSVNEDVLALIAKYADGSMRDAEVILDQITSFSKGIVELEDVIKVLGLVDEDMLFGLSGSIRAKDPVSALKLIDRIVNDGKDTVQVITSLIEHFRNLSIVKISKDLHSIIDVGSDKIARYEDEAGKFSIEEILYIIYTLSNAIDFIRRSNLAKIPFEAAMIKLTRIGPVMPLAHLTERLEKIGEGQRPISDPDEPVRKAPEAVRIVKELAPVPAKEAVSDADTKKESSGRPAPAQEASLKTPALDHILGSWNMVISHIKAKKMSLALYLQEGYPISVEGDVVTIGFPKEYTFHKEALELPDNKRIIEQSLKAALNIDTRTRYVINESARPQESVQRGYREEPDRGSRSEEGLPLKKDTEVEPIIKDAMEMFGGEINESGKGGSR